MSEKSNSSGCLITISAGVIAFTILAAFGAIGEGLIRLGKSIPWWLYIIIIAAFMYLYHSKDSSE